MEKTNIIQKYLRATYPTAPELSAEEIQALMDFLSPADGMNIKHIVDYFNRKIVYVEGVESALFIPTNEWTLERLMASIPKPYDIPFEKIAETGYFLFQKHKLARFGSGLCLQRNGLLRDAKGKVYNVTQFSKSILHQDGSIILNMTKYQFGLEWTINSAPVDFRPLLFADNSRLTTYENELIDLSMAQIFSDLHIPAEWLPVVQCHFDGNYTNREIAQMTKLNPTTVDYYNRMLKSVFEKFSAQIKTAKDGVDYFKRQGLKR